MIHRLIVLTAIFAIVLFAAALEAGDPLNEWLESLPRSSNDTLYAHGVGDGKAEALLNALIDISSQIERSVTSSSEQGRHEIKRIITQSFGDVKIESYCTFTESSQATNATTWDAESFRKAAKLIYYKDDKKLILTELYSSESEAPKNRTAHETSFGHSFRMDNENCTLSDVIAELESNGIAICRTFAAPETYCMLIECTLAKLPKSRPTGELSDTLWTRPDDQTLKELEESIRLYEERKKKR